MIIVLFSKPLSFVQYFLYSLILPSCFFIEFQSVARKKKNEDDDDQITENEVETGGSRMENKDEDEGRNKQRMVMVNVSVALGKEASFKCAGFEVIVSIKR